ncbi:MAG TPA: lysylphosphatidylglycerol synthase transmembrane domain-containing protein [Streptosporangiaceae bacterium]|nr:lysylphosphatidylglycerol synthase transmembrane domain-containing protein [Streptosporangiaceae bacterium]
MSQDAQEDKNGTRPKGWRARLWTARRPLRRLAILLILALIVEYLVIPELVGASRDFYLLGRLNVGWMVFGLILEAFSLFCYALLNRVLLPPKGRPSLSRLFRIDLVAAAVAHVIPAGTVGSAGIGFQLFTAEGIDGTDVGVMMATKGMGSTVVLNVLLWISLVISIPLSGFRPIYETVAVVGAILLALVAAVIIGITRGEKRAARVLHMIGDRIPKVGGDRLEQVVLQAAASIRALGHNRAQLAESLTWAAMNWLLDAASLWCFIAAFGRFANPIGLFAAYGIANVLAAVPLTPGGLGIIDSVLPLLLVGFGLTRSVATLGVLSWRLVNFWLPIPAGAVAYASLKVPPGRGLRAVRHAFHEMTTRGSSHDDHAQRPPEGDGDHPDGRDQATLSSEGTTPQPEPRDSHR